MKLIATLLMLLVTTIIQAQSNPRTEDSIILKHKLSTDTVVFRNVRIKTDVFVLNTCDPQEVSFRRKYDDDSLSFGPKKRTRKLELRPNTLSSFKIEGINPLRYQYFINSEAVTQFVDANPLPSLSNVLLRDANFSPFDISVPQIFKAEITKNNSRNTIDSFENLINKYKDSLNDVTFQLQQLSSEYPIPEVRFNTKYEALEWSPSEKKQAEVNTKKAQPTVDEFIRLQKKLNNYIVEFEKYLRALPVNSNDFSILSEADAVSNKDVNQIVGFIDEFKNKYSQLNKDFQKIDMQISRIANNYSLLTNEETITDLNKDLSNYGYKVYNNQNELYGQSRKIELLDLREFLINKRYQVLQEFVLSTATKIGIMLQSAFRDVSQYTNKLKMQNCLTSEEIDTISNYRRKVNEAFDFVQKTNAEFQILISYLDIDNKIYSDIAKGINTNYLGLTSYMKVLDVLEDNNTIEFTLPTSTNLKNIDLIRYKIDRTDKVAGGQQSYTYDLWVRGGLKVDFSVGIFASGLTDIQFQKYQYDSAGKMTDSVEISRQKTGDYSFGFGGMINITPRLGASWVNAGLSLGIIYSTNQRLQFITAGAFHLGKTERLILHAGVGFGFINSIDRSQQHMTVVEKDNVYRVKASVNDYSIPTLQKFSVKPIFGISYNLSGKNALQAVSDKGLDRYNQLNTGTSTSQP